MTPNNLSSTKNTLSEKFAGRAAADRAFVKLNALFGDVAGLGLTVLVRTSHHMVEIHPAGGEDAMPRFCRVFGAASRGPEECLACRSLVAFGACNRGLNEYECHGGVFVIAAPTVRRDGTVSRRVVVATRPFAFASHAHGWPLLESQARILGADIPELREAYNELPVVTEYTRQLARQVTELAALVLGELEEQFARENPDAAQGASSDKKWCYSNVEECWAPLSQARDWTFEETGKPAGAALVGLFVAMVNRDPAAPYTVARIARAARVTPNYFSAVFSKHMGQTFRTFLGEQRVVYAQELLRSSSLDVAEVARSSGFPDPAYFARRFKRATGCTPTEWRMGVEPPG